MIEFKEAIQIILSNAKVLDIEEVELHNAANRVLAEDTFYDINIPPFDKSAMDGFACRKQDIQNELTIVETIFAGKKPEKCLGENECAKIMTGAVLPEGADMVFMVEHSKESGINTVRCTKENSNTNVCYKAEDVKTGELALGKSTLIEPKHIPVLASAGIHKPKVYKQPRVGVFATGTELVEPEIKPLPHQIRNSNSSQMLAQLAQIGISGNYMGIIKDSREETEQKIKNALEKNDILILSGGVSVGDFDFVPETIEKLGFEILLYQSAIQPGRPVVFARRNDKYCFGLAGNPVSSFIQFDIYIKPFIYALMGHNYSAYSTQAVLTEHYKRKKTNRLKFIPAIFKDGKVAQVEYNGSAHIHALVHANCLIEVPLGIGEINEGETVNVRSI